MAQYLETITIPQIDTSDPAKAIASLRRYMKSLHKLPDPESGVAERDITLQEMATSCALMSTSQQKDPGHCRR